MKVTCMVQPRTCQNGLNAHYTHANTDQAHSKLFQRIRFSLSHFFLFFLTLDTKSRPITKPLDVTRYQLGKTPHFFTSFSSTPSYDSTIPFIDEL
jgi:hypothetical protein